MKNLAYSAAIDLPHLLHSSEFVGLVQKYRKQAMKAGQQSFAKKEDSILIETPSTTVSIPKRASCAISKSRNNINKSSSKKREKVGEKILQDNEQEQTEMMNWSQMGKQQNPRKIKIDRAVYYGSDASLPYLHSSDAISSLYEKAKIPQLTQPLLNPNPNINPHYLTTIKSLCLYYTEIDSLRQLGTGWSGLKLLTIMCSIQLKDLSGLSIFPSLQYLFVPHNSISDISDIMYHSTLKCVDLQDNQIDLIDQVEYLYTINLLEWVDISHNPITKKKEQYRIIAENLGNKLQPEMYTRDIEYLNSQDSLTKQFESYENMEWSNYPISQFNQQVANDDIKLGQFWRISKKNKQKVLEKDQQFISFSEPFYLDDNQYDHMHENQIFEKLEMFHEHESSNFQVTPLQEFIETQLDLQPLKKYFYNKVCPQNIVDKNGQMRQSIKKVGMRPMKRSTGKQSVSPEASSLLKSEKGSNSIINARRFGVTQNISSMRNHHQSQEKQKREASISLNKHRLKKLSLSKNIHSMVSAQIPNSKFSEFNPHKMIGTQGKDSLAGSKMLGKRRIIGNLQGTASATVNLVGTH